MASYSRNSAVSTYVFYKKRYYECFDFNDLTTTSIDSIRTCIAGALEIPALSPHDIVEIENDDKRYVVLNGHYLTNNHPWRSYTNGQQSLPSTKNVNLRIVSDSGPESNIHPVFVPTTYALENNDQATASTTNKDQQTSSATSIDLNNAITTTSDTNDYSRFLSNDDDPPAIEVLRSLAQYSPTPLKFFQDVGSSQRLCYPNGKDLVLIHTSKEAGDEKKPIHPTLQIPDDHVTFLKAGGLVDVISAVVNKVDNEGGQISFCLARHRGFWPPGKANRPPPDTPFSNPFIFSITSEQLQEKTDAGESIFIIELPLCLMYAVGTRYDTKPQPLVLFDQDFNLSKAKPVPSHYDFSVEKAPTTANGQITVNKNECYIWCALRSDPQSDFQDLNSGCGSAMFTVEARPRSNETKAGNNQGSRKRQHP